MQAGAFEGVDDLGGRGHAAFRDARAEAVDADVVAGVEGAVGGAHEALDGVL